MIDRLKKSVAALLGGLALSIAAFTATPASAAQQAAQNGGTAGDVCNDHAATTANEPELLATNHWKRCPAPGVTTATAPGIRLTLGISVNPELVTPELLSPPQAP